MRLNKYLRFVISSSSLLKAYHHWRLSRKYRDQRTIIGFGASIDNSEVGFDVYVGTNTQIINSLIGSHTYFNSSTVVADAVIGKFCSIGSNVKIGIGSHPTFMVSTHPCFYANNKGFKSFADKMYYNSEIGTIHIGNDVWIGSDACILNNVKIGNGAIIALGSIVTKDVPDYAIVAGVPARVIKYRFSKENVKSLLRIKWWDLEAHIFENNYKDFHDLESFVKGYDKN